MAVRVADYLKQQNDLESFPVAYGSAIWLDKSGSKSSGDFKSIQEMYNDGELGGGGAPGSSSSGGSVGLVTDGDGTKFLADDGTYKGMITADGYDHSKFAYLDELTEIDASKILSQQQADDMSKLWEKEDYVKRPELTPIPLDKFLDRAEIDGFYKKLELDDYVKLAMLSEVDASQILTQQQADAVRQAFEYDVADMVKRSELTAIPLGSILERLNKIEDAVRQLGGSI